MSNLERCQEAGQIIMHHVEDPLFISPTNFLGNYTKNEGANLLLFHSLKAVHHLSP